MIRDVLRTARFIAEHPLGSRHKLMAWRRWFKWQITSRLSPGPKTVPWISPSCLVLKRGATGGTGNLYCGLHEFCDMALLLHYFLGNSERGRERFVDVGANVGSYSILASKVCGALTLALEPVPSSYELLMSNIRANEVLELVEAHSIAAGSCEGSLKFSIDDGPMNRIVDSTYVGNQIDVGVARLDMLLEGRNSHFWKIDVEGAELEVLAGAKSSLECDTLQVVLLESGDCKITNIMKASGFQLVRYDPWTRTLLDGGQQQQIGNNIWVRELERVQERCRCSPRFAVLGEEI